MSLWGLGFGLPFFVIIPAIIAGSTIVYLLNERRSATRDLVVPYVKFCNRMLRGTGRKWPRWLILFILQILALILLIAAASRPYKAGQTEEGKYIVIILDKSLSMKAKSGGTTRFEEAKQEALKIIEKANPLDKVTVIIAGVTPQALEEQLTKEKLKQIIIQLKPGNSLLHLRGCA